MERYIKNISAAGVVVSCTIPILSIPARRISVLIIQLPFELFMQL